MPTFVIGDIHGCLKSLEALVEFVAPKKTDTLVTLGDYIDRGPSSKSVIDFLSECRNPFNLVTLKGNHEQMMENARHSEQEQYFWLANGGETTLDSFCTTNLDEINNSYWRFMAQCKLYHETDQHIIVHAGLDPKLPLDKQPKEVLLWKRIFDTEQHVSGKKLICGHTSQRSGDPLILDHAVCIDTNACGSGWLTCMDIDNEKYWQANEQGETRMWSSR